MFQLCHNARRYTIPLRDGLIGTRTQIPRQILGPGITEFCLKGSNQILRNLMLKLF